MTNTIMDTGNVAELQGLGPDDEISNLAATHEPTGNGIEFHVSMQGYTMRDMEELIVHAAAYQIVGRFNDRDLAKQIEAKCIELITSKANAALAKVTTEIVDQPIMPSYGDKAPVTMREFIGLTGREYLSQMVDEYDKPATSSYNSQSRIQRLVSKHMDRHFKNEIEKATNAAISEVRSAIEGRHKELIKTEKQRLADALSKLTAA